VADDWRDLRMQFLAALERYEETPERWRILWALFVSHPWHQRELHAAARRLAAGSGADLAGDVAHEALLLLARDLRHAPSLGLERVRGEEGFLPWMRTIIDRHCREARRALRRRRGRETEIDENDHPVDSGAALDARLDLYRAVKQLPQRERLVVELYLDGWNLAQIAAQVTLPYPTVYSLWKRAIGRMRESLAD
jgi:RNA polymerase sigma factor (sigma-70 family)